MVSRKRIRETSYYPKHAVALGDGNLQTCVSVKHERYEDCVRKGANPINLEGSGDPNGIASVDIGYGVAIVALVVTKVGKVHAVAFHESEVDFRASTPGHLQDVVPLMVLLASVVQVR